MVGAGGCPVAPGGRRYRRPMTSMRAGRRPRRLLVALVAGALALVPACSSDDEEPAATTTTTTASTTTTTDAPRTTERTEPPTTAPPTTSTTVAPSTAPPTSADPGDDGAGDGGGGTGDDLDAAIGACVDGDASACFDIGAAGVAMPVAIDDGNDWSLAPDAVLAEQCFLSGVPVACWEAGRRGLSRPG